MRIGMARFLLQLHIRASTSSSQLSYKRQATSCTPPQRRGRGRERGTVYFKTISWEKQAPPLSSPFEAIVGLGMVNNLEGFGRRLIYFK